MFYRRESFPDLFREVNRLRDELSGAFQRGGIAMPFTDGGTVPPLNISENADTLSIEAELPGINVEKLDISVTEGNRLTIQGQRSVLELKNAAWHRQERGHGNFIRVVTLPTLVDTERVTANYDAGILRMSLPKAEAAKPRKINVKCG